jgi:four helix bundle protein
MPETFGHCSTIAVPKPLSMADFKRLQVWKAARTLTLQIYRESAAFPHHEQLGLTNQLRRAAVSIGANIAEGCARGGDREFARFLTMSIGSVAEVEFLLLLAIDLGYLCDAKLVQEAIIVARMLYGLRRETLQSGPPDR